MTQHTKHIGKLKNLGRRIIVITAKIPGKETHSLIVDTDSLRDAYLNSLMDVVVSPEAQSVDDLGTALMRIPSPERGVSWLMNLHNNNLMFPEPIDNIIMFPTPNDPISLREEIREEVDDGASDVYEEATRYETNQQPESLHSLSDIVKTNDIANKDAIAMNLISEANRFKMEAERKLEEAYRIAPNLKPAVESQKVYSAKVSPSVSPEKVKEYIESFEIDIENTDVEMTAIKPTRKKNTTSSKRVTSKK